MFRIRLTTDLLKQCVRECVKITKPIKCSKLLSTQASNKWIIESDHKPINIPEVSFSQYIFDAQEKYANRVSLVNGETGQTFTHGEVRTLSIKLGSALVKRGVQKGDVIGIVSPNCPEFLVAFLGVASVGAINTTVNCTYTPEEIGRQLENAKATRVIVHPLLLPIIKKTQQVYPALKDVIVICGPAVPGTISFSDLLADDGTAFPHNLQINPKEDLCVMPYSSGTTGLPKGVMLTHHNLVANIEQVICPGVAPMRHAHGDFQEVFLGVLPMFHIYGMVPCMSVIICLGGQLVTMMKFDPVVFVDLIVKHKVTFLPIVPPIVNYLVTSPDVTAKHLESVHSIICGAAPSGNTLIENCLRKFNHGVHYVEGFGLTETSPVTHMTRPNISATGSVGLCLPNTKVKIVDLKTGESIGPNEGQGELCIQGPQVMKGYFNNDKATKETLDDEGWLHTGDIAKMDENKNVFIVDRLKELIKVKGLQVAPAELEDLLRSHPAVLDVAVIGVPDERAGEYPRAYIVKSPGSEVTGQEIADFVEKEVAPHKKLAGGVVFIDAIPKSATGKILRRELKAEAMA